MKTLTNEHSWNTLLILWFWSETSVVTWTWNEKYLTSTVHILHIIGTVCIFYILCWTCNISWIIYWNFETVSSCWVCIQTESLSSFTSSGACDFCLNFKQQVNLHELHRNMDILWKKYIIWMPENSVFPPKNVRKSPENHRFSPSRKKLNISKNPWHHPLALGPSIDLPTSYIVSKFGVISSSRSWDIRVFVSDKNWQLSAIFGWLILHVVGRPHSPGSAVGCSLPV